MQQQNMIITQNKIITHNVRLEFCNAFDLWKILKDLIKEWKFALEKNHLHRLKAKRQTDVKEQHFLLGEGEKFD